MVKEENRDPSERRLVTAGCARVTLQAGGARFPEFRCGVNVTDVMGSHYRCSHELTGIALFVAVRL